MTMRSEPKPDREFLRLQWRGMRLLSRYIPHFFAAVTWHSIIMAITPYVVVWFAATVLDALVDGAASSTLCGLSIAGISTGAGMKSMTASSSF